MEPLVLTDKNVRPTDELVFSIIGKNKQHWQNLFQLLHSKFPEIEEQWNYYNDGKNWLMKTLRKKKNLFWTAIHADTFRVSFYFGDKAESLIEQSDLPPEIISEFKSGKRYGKIRAISMKVNESSDVENILKLVDIRIKV